MLTNYNALTSEFQHAKDKGVKYYLDGLAVKGYIYKAWLYRTNKNEMSLPSEKRRFHLTEALKKILKERNSHQLENTVGTKKKEGELEK
ncbi:hypothetical protein H5410_022743 [Solanum commersonii]|uniref:Uncharacterized protein n=1 Tax=Solanum commersonii TaxID=4109 RepID=A0A9J5ZJN4_SOLCO|nr:hypothetical protein H5410_022743 [Solanum commersonii]